MTRRIIPAALVALTLTTAQPAHAGWIEDTWDRVTDWVGNTFGGGSQSESAADVISRTQARYDLALREGRMTYEQYVNATRANARLAIQAGNSLAASTANARLATQDALRARQAGKISAANYQRVVSRSRDIIERNERAATHGTANNPSSGCGCR